MNKAKVTFLLLGIFAGLVYCTLKNSFTDHNNMAVTVRDTQSSDIAAPEKTTTAETESNTEVHSSSVSGSSVEPIPDFDEVLTVNDSEQFFDYLRIARNSLVKEVKMKINNYNDEEYDIQKLDKGKFVLSSEGKLWGNTAYMTYTFTYSDNYMISRATEDPELEVQLSAGQLDTIDQLKSIKQSLVTDNMSDYEKELALHDYLVKNYSYDTSVTETDAIPESATGITDFLKNKKGVCEAYAYTFKALCDLCGMDCYVISGQLNGVGHAWNLVCIDNELYHIDVTSDDPVPDEPGHCYYSYFNLSDAEIAKTHILENKWYTCNTDKYNYFIYNGLVVSSSDEFIKQVEKQLNSGSTTILFKANNYYVNDNDINTALLNKGFTSYVITGNTSDPFGDFEMQLNKN